MAEVTLDLFPCNLQAGDQRHERVRVMLVDGRAHALGYEDGAPVEVASADVVTVDQGGYWPYRITTLAGPWVMTRAAGCGCGHPLKRARQADLVTLVAP